MFSKTFLVLLSAAQLAAGLSPSRAAGSVLAVSIVQLAASSSTADSVETANVNADALQCEEPEACSGSESNNTDAASEGEAETIKTDDDSSSISTSRTAPNGDPIVTHEELAQYKGLQEGETIWLSILGKVFDVTTGPKFYAQLGDYKFYSGKDASTCFGYFGKDKEEGQKANIEDMDDDKLMKINTWAEFYDEHESYVYKGVLGGSKYFDDEGNETPLRQDIVIRARAEKKIWDKEQAKIKEEKRKRREARKNKYNGFMM